MQPSYRVVNWTVLKRNVQELCLVVAGISPTGAMQAKIPFQTLGSSFVVKSQCRDSRANPMQTKSFKILVCLTGPTQCEQSWPSMPSRSFPSAVRPLCIGLREGKHGKGSNTAAKESAGKLPDCHTSFRLNCGTFISTQG